jgi:hypothetical protein
MAVYEVRSNEAPACPICHTGSGPYAPGMSPSLVNHIVEDHEGTLRFVGQETTDSSDDGLWHIIVYVVESEAPVQPWPDLPDDVSRIIE